MFIGIIILGSLVGTLLLTVPALREYGGWGAVAKAHGDFALFDSLLSYSWISCWLTVLSAFLSGLLSFRHRQVLASLNYAGPSICSILGMAAFHSRLGPISALLGQIAGSALTTTVFLFHLRQLITWHIRFTSFIETSSQLVRMFPWVIAGVLCFVSYPLIDAYLTAQLPEGSYASLAYGQRLIIAAVNLVVAGPIFMLVKRVSTTDAKLNAADLLSGLGGVAAVLTPVAIVTYVFSTEIVALAMGYGRFSESAQQSTATSLAAYAPGIVFMGTGAILSRVMFALKRQRVAAVQSLCWLALYALLGLYLRDTLRAPGVALAYSASWAIVVCTTLLLLTRGNQVARATLVRGALVLLLGTLVAITLGGSARAQFLHDQGRGIATLIVGSAVIFGSFMVSTLGAARALGLRRGEKRSSHV